MNNHQADYHEIKIATTSGYMSLVIDEAICISGFDKFEADISKDNGLLYIKALPDEKMQSSIKCEIDTQEFAKSVMKANRDTCGGA